MKNSKLFLLPNLFIFVISLIFWNYNISIFLIAILLLIVVFKDDLISLTNLQKRIIKSLVFIFIFITKLIPIFFNKYFIIWNTTFQKNYLNNNFVPETIFGDMQGLLFSVSCNNLLSNTIETYSIRYTYLTIQDAVYNCPVNINYPSIFNYFDLDSANVWNLTVFIAVTALLSLYCLYLYLLNGKTGKEFLIVSALFVSPPVNFLIQRLNIDLLIFLILFLIFNNKNLSFSLKNFIIFFISLVKFYPIFLIFAASFISLKKKLYFQLFFLLPLITLSLIYLFSFSSNTNVVSFYFRATESNRAFGILNDSAYISEFLNISIYLSLLLVALFLTVLLFLFKNLKIENIGDEEFIQLSMFLGICVFINYDYRVIFLLLLTDFLLKESNKKFLATACLFIYSSPTLLHAYDKYFYLVENDQFYFFDLSFYLLLTFMIKQVWNYLKSK